MTQLSVETAASLQIQPPRSKPARDDAAPPRDDFAALVKDNEPRPAEPARTRSSDQPDRPRANNDRRDETVKAESDAPAPDKETPVADAAPATSDTVKPEPVKVETTKPDADAPAPDAVTPDATAVAVTVAAITPQIVPQTPVVPVVAAAPAPTAEAGPLSIAAAALAATAATVEATTPTKPATDLVAASADPVLAASASVTPALKVAAKATTPALDGPTTDAAAPQATTDSKQPAATAPAPQAAKAETQPAAKPDDTPADTIVTPAPHERHAAAAQPSLTDATVQTFTPPQHTAAPTATTLATAVPQISVVASQTAPVPLNGLAMQIAATAISGKTSFDIRLDPAELGRIDVRLDVDRHGNVTSHLTVEKPETLAMLRQDAPQLQRALTDAGLQTSDKGLQFSLSDQSLSGQNNNQNSNPDDNRRPMQRLVIADDDNLSIASAGRSYGRMLASSSGVDIRI